MSLPVYLRVAFDSVHADEAKSINFPWRRWNRDVKLGIEADAALIAHGWKKVIGQPRQLDVCDDAPWIRWRHPAADPSRHGRQPML